MLPQPLSRPLLDRLADEEALLRAAVASAAELHAALLSGNRARLAAVQVTQEDLAGKLAAAADARHHAGAALSDSLGRPAGSPLTLSALAESLPEPEADELQTVRDRLSAVASELSRLNGRNANLVGHLRSYFRGILAGLAGGTGVDRYGPSGARLGPVGGALQARG